MTAGYSGTPLAKKLGISAGSTVTVIGTPAGPDVDVAALLDPIPDGVELISGTSAEAAVTLLFVSRRADLEAKVPAIGEAIFPDRVLWVCWPKKASKQPTDITEDTIREVVLPLGLVDIKVCAVSEIWSGLKIMWRKDRRSDSPAQPSA